MALEPCPHCGESALSRSRRDPTRWRCFACLAFGYGETPENPDA